MSVCSSAETVHDLNCAVADIDNKQDVIYKVRRHGQCLRTWRSLFVNGKNRSSSCCLFTVLEDAGAESSSDCVAPGDNTRARKQAAVPRFKVPVSRHLLEGTEENNEKPVLG